MKKPSNIKVVKAKKTSLLLPSFRAITLFGTIFCKRQSDVELINKTDFIDSILKCHETIHVRQAENTKNSWLLFYLNYIYQWIKNIPLIFIKPIYAYKFIPYELEAFANETNYNYINQTTNQWRMFNEKLKLKNKIKYAKQYKKINIIFRDYINKYILNEIN